jgi:hypothetical protein
MLTSTLSSFSSKRFSSSSCAAVAASSMAQRCSEASCMFCRRCITRFAGKTADDDAATADADDDTLSTFWPCVAGEGDDSGEATTGMVITCCLPPSTSLASIFLLLHTLMGLFKPPWYDVSSQIFHERCHNTKSIQRQKSHRIVGILASHTSDQVDHVFSNLQIPLLLLIIITMKLLLLLIVTANRWFQRRKHSWG